ncbi:MULTISPECIES: hypothetical protein [Neobacillus]|uniref:Uncharacterized protein n=1 Tax=Neobacillus citreus TaxID=2833578 RepID=A0A942T5K5_9BACI|nr:hypothetical protein [Neobacillus citreus]MCH6269011.1 hypothetical protein [Neobacillus citreus]
MNGKEIEELKVELNRVKEQNQELFQTIVEPGLHSKVQEFLDSFEDYFRERGFVIRKKNDKVRVSFDDLHLKAFSDGGRDIFIMRGKEQIASVTVKFIGEGKKGIQSQMDDSLDQLEKEMEKEKSFTDNLKNPVFYYTGRDFGYKYETPLSVLDSIFGI